MPYLCKEAEYDQCNRQPVAWATANQTYADLPFETPIGLAKDGHIIVGPYN